jgi:hypothetical protein
MEIREGTAGTIRNFIVTGFKENGIDISNTATIDQANAGALSFANGIIFGNGLLSGTANLDSNARAIPSIASNPTLLIGGGNDPGLIDPFNHTNPNYRPATGSLATTHPPALQPNDGFFEVALFIGAVPPAPAQDWTQTGWADFTQD